MPHARPKLLFVSLCTPDVLGTGWEQRAHSFLEAYSKSMDIELWFQPTPDNPELVRASTLFDLCKSVISFSPILLSRNVEDLRGRLMSAVRNADCVHIGRYTNLVLKIDDPCILWDIDELPPYIREASKDILPGLSDFKKDTYKNIRDAWKKSRIVFSSSALERHEKFAEPVVVPNSHSRTASVQRQPLPNSLLFVGSMNHSPNVDGISYFVSEVLPLLKHQISLTIVGRSPHQSELRTTLDQLKGNERVRIFYDVPSCAPYYDQSLASIVPIRVGGGTKVKIVESFAAMCPVISTQKGCEGMAVSNERELLIADTPADFASACTRLLDDVVLNKKLANSAHEFFLSEHSQKVVDGIVGSVLAEVLATVPQH